MKRFGSILALTAQIAGSGCAAHRPPLPQIPKGTGSPDWSAVVALPRGHLVRVTLDDGQSRRGLILRVSEASLTLRVVEGETTVPRAEIARVVEQVQIGTKRAPWYVGVPVATAVLGGLAGVIVGAVTKNKAVRNASGKTFFIGLLSGIALGPLDYPRAVLEDRPVYTSKPDL